MGVSFNRNKKLRDFFSLLKWNVKKTLKYIPKRLNSNKRKLPDFIITGAMKGGTSSLFYYLSQHPQIEVSREQEIHFFAKYYHRGLKFYKSFFPFMSSGKITGESSPYYLFHPQVPKRIKKDIPNAKIIVLLRDPVIRAFSHYQMHKGIDPSFSFEEAISLEQNRVSEAHEKMKLDPNFKSSSHQAYSYISRGKYFEQISNWLNFYTLDELIIIKSEEFFENPKSTLRDIYLALNIEEVYPSDLKNINSRSYEDLSKENYLKYKTLFKDDNDKLAELLGPKFIW